jgi:methyl-accepting chemotaxis protein
VAGTGGLGAAFDNRSLRTKISSAVLVATVVGVAVGAVSLNTLNDLNASSTAAQKQNLAVMKASATVGQNIESVVGASSGIKAYPGIAAQIAAGMAVSEKAVDTGLSTLSTNLTDTKGKATVSKMQADWKAFTAFMSGTQSGTSAADQAAGLAKYNTLRGALTADQKAVETLVGNRVTAEIKDGEDRTSAATRNVLILLVIGVVLSLYLGLRVANRVRRAVAGVSGVAEGLAEGDLTRSSGVTVQDEVGQMAASLDRGIARLREDIIQLAGNATTLQTSAAQLTSVSGAVN